MEKSYTGQKLACSSPPSSIMELTTFANADCWVHDTDWTIEPLLWFFFEAPRGRFKVRPLLENRKGFIQIYSTQLRTRVPRRLQLLGHLGRTNKWTHTGIYAYTYTNNGHMHNVVSNSMTGYIVSEILSFFPEWFIYKGNTSMYVMAHACAYPPSYLFLIFISIIQWNKLICQSTIIYLYTYICI